MSVLLQLQKRTMAIAGLVMMLYLIFHMISNLSFFTERSFTHFYDWYNEGVIRWLVLLAVIFALFVHVKAAVRIRQVNANTRIINYKKYDKFKIPPQLVTASISFLLGFIIIHIIQTLSFDTRSLYTELVHLFQSGWMLLFYLAGLLVLGLHLHHSLANVLQTLGKTSVVYSRMAFTISLLLNGGFALLPLYIYFEMS